MNADAPMHRRQLLGMLGGSAVLAAGWGAPSPAGATAADDTTLDLKDLGARVRAFVKTSGRLDPGRVIWSTRAEVYAFLPPDGLEPVLRVKGCEQQWMKPLSDTEFLSFDSLVSYYCDFESDRVMREFDNPFTGARNAVRPNISRMTEGREISPRGVVYRVMRRAYPDFYGDSEFDVVVRQVGGTVSFQGENRWPPEFIRPPAGSKLTMFARGGDLADPDLSSAPSQLRGPRPDAVFSRGWTWRTIPATCCGTCKAIRSRPLRTWTRTTLPPRTPTWATDSNARPNSTASHPGSPAGSRPWGVCRDEAWEAV